MSHYSPKNPHLMFQSPASRLAGTALLAGLLFGGPAGCSPSVTEIELNAARSKQADTREKLKAMDAEIAALHAEEKTLKPYEGPQHEAALKQAAELQKEKQELETIKSEVDAKIEKFTTGAAVHREALTKQPAP